MFALIENMDFLLVILVLASVMEYSTIYVIYSNDNSLGSACTQLGGFSSGWRGKHKDEDVGQGGPEARTGESLTEHR